MEFIFEDEVDEVGSDVEAYCPKCKADTTHVVISKYEDEIRRVQCNPCGDVHSFRKPRGETEEDVPEPVAAKKRALIRKPNWEEFFAKHKSHDAKPYEFREAYRENVIVTHPKFGPGFVSEVVSDSKVEITFKDGRRILVHNRKDIPGLPLAAEGDGTPTPPPAKAASKKEAAKESSKDSAAKESAKDAKDSKAAKDPHAEPNHAREGKDSAASKERDAGKTTDSKAATKAVAPAKVSPIKPEAKGGKAVAKPPVKVAKAAAPRGGKTAAKPAAKKPAGKPVKKAAKKR